MSALDNAIAKAATELGVKTEETVETPEVSEETKEETSEETSEETEETTEEEEQKSESDELSESEIQEARFLYKSLKNPDLRPAILASLAEQVQKPVETKKEQQVVKKDIQAMIKESLGPEYAFMADKLGKAIESAIEVVREEHKAETQRTEAERVNADVVREMALLAKETKGESAKLEPIMAKLSEVIQPGPNASIASYIRILYREASAGSQQKRTEAKVADKIRRNANDAPSRLQTASTALQTDNRGIPTKKMNLNESVAWAAQQVADNNKSRRK